MLKLIVNFLINLLSCFTKRTALVISPIKMSDNDEPIKYPSPLKNAVPGGRWKCGKCYKNGNLRYFMALRTYKTHMTESHAAEYK